MNRHPEAAYELLTYWLDNWKPDDPTHFVNYAHAFEQDLPERFRIWVAYWESAGLMARTPTLGLDRPQAELLLHLRQLAPPAPVAAPATAPERGDVLKQIEALLGTEGQRALAVARRTDLSSDDKMRAIADIDFRVKGWASLTWAELLGVSDAQIRKNSAWKEWQAAKKDSE